MPLLGDSREEFCATCESVTRQVLENQDVAGSLDAVAQRWWCLDGYHEWPEPAKTGPPNTGLPNTGFQNNGFQNTRF